MQCQGVTLVPIYGHPTEKFVTRNTYTHAGAEQECKTHNLTLAKEALPTYRITDCIKLHGQKVLSTTNVQNQFYWLGDCRENKCKYFQGHSHAIRNIGHTDNIDSRKASTLALCHKGKIHLVPQILHHLRTILNLL